MKLTIFGSTGGTVRKIVAQALEQGHEVTAFARSPEKLGQTHEKLQVIKGDVFDLASLERAIQGRDAVLCSLGLPPMDKSNLRAKGTKNIIRAMEKYVFTFYAAFSFLKNCSFRTIIDTTHALFTGF